MYEWIVWLHLALGGVFVILQALDQALMDISGRGLYDTIDVLEWSRAIT